MNRARVRESLKNKDLSSFVEVVADIDIGLHGSELIDSAAYRGFDDALEHLVNLGARTYPPDPEGSLLVTETLTPRRVELLVAAGADPTAPIQNSFGIVSSPLSNALDLGHADVVEALLKCGALPDGEQFAVTPCDPTGLPWAHLQRVELAEMFRQYGATFQFDSWEEDFVTEAPIFVSALVVAVRNDLLDLAQFYLDNGLAMGHRAKEIAQALAITLDRKPFIDLFSESHSPEVLLLVMRYCVFKVKIEDGFPEAVQRLQEHGGDTDELIASFPSPPTWISKKLERLKTNS